MPATTTTPKNLKRTKTGAPSSPRKKVKNASSKRKSSREDDDDDDLPPMTQPSTTTASAAAADKQSTKEDDDNFCAKLAASAPVATMATSSDDSSSEVPPLSAKMYPQLDELGKIEVKFMPKESTKGSGPCGHMNIYIGGKKNPKVELNHGEIIHARANVEGNIEEPGQFGPKGNPSSTAYTGCVAPIDPDDKDDPIYRDLAVFDTIVERLTDAILANPNQHQKMFIDPAVEVATKALKAEFNDMLVDNPEMGRVGLSEDDMKDKKKAKAHREKLCKDWMDERLPKLVRAHIKENNVYCSKTEQKDPCIKFKRMCFKNVYDFGLRQAINKGLNAGKPKKEIARDFYRSQKFIDEYVDLAVENEDVVDLLCVKTDKDSTVYPRAIFYLSYFDATTKKRINPKNVDIKRFGTCGWVSGDFNVFYHASKEAKRYIVRFQPKVIALSGYENSRSSMNSSISVEDAVYGEMEL